MRLPGWLTRRTPESPAPAPIVAEFTFAQRTIDFLGKAALADMAVKDVRANALHNRIDINGWVIGCAWSDTEGGQRCVVTASVVSLTEPGT